MGCKYYIASWFDTRERLRPCRDKLWKMGYECVSSWLDEVKKPEGMSEEVFRKKLAIKDLTEIKSADLLIIDTIDVTERGGREVEFGYALGKSQANLIYLVGPIRNVFHTLVDKHFNDWTELIKYLEKE